MNSLEMKSLRQPTRSRYILQWTLVEFLQLWQVKNENVQCVSLSKQRCSFSGYSTKAENEQRAMTTTSAYTDCATRLTAFRVVWACRVITARFLDPSRRGALVGCACRLATRQTSA